MALNGLSVFNPRCVLQPVCHGVTVLSGWLYLVTPKRPFKPAKGFTLAELLVALSILGLIAAFTVPKILNSADLSKKKAVFKEVYSTLYQLAWQYRQAGSQGRLDDYLIDHINAVKKCPNTVIADGCRTTPMLYDWGDKGVLMANGAVVTIFGNNSYGDFPQHAQIEIDWNGDAEPNDGTTTSLDTSDTVSLYVNGSQSTVFLGGTYYYQPGKLVAWEERTPYLDLYTQVF